jgi:hypothetical protein
VQRINCKNTLSFFIKNAAVNPAAFFSITPRPDVLVGLAKAASHRQQQQQQKVVVERISCAHHYKLALALFSSKATEGR